MGLSPALDQKFFVLFFRLCETFLSQYFLMSPKGPPSFFSILQKNGCSKTLKEPSFTFFGTVRLTGDQKEFQKIQKIRIFFQFFPHAGTVEENT